MGEVIHEHRRNAGLCLGPCPHRSGEDAVAEQVVTRCRGFGIVRCRIQREQLACPLTVHLRGVTAEVVRLARHRIDGGLVGIGADQNGNHHLATRLEDLIRLPRQEHAVHGGPRRVGGGNDDVAAEVAQFGDRCGIELGAERRARRFGGASVEHPLAGAEPAAFADRLLEQPPGLRRRHQDRDRRGPC